MGKYVLVVEDDPDIAQSVAEVLEAGGYRSVTAGNGQEALEDLQKYGQPALILLDMGMPVMDGWEFRRRQVHLAGSEAIPVIVLTADGHAPEKAKAVSADGFLRKPVTISVLLGTVERVCGSPDACGSSGTSKSPEARRPPET